jgi:SAM-dependent methyltransferase
MAFLLRYRVFRDAMAQASPDSEAFRRSRIEKFYQEGSVGITFPKSPPEMAPAVFARYMETTKSPWFEWMRTHTPVKDVTNHKLLDVGSGPGFIGQHFQWLGYRITALTGNESERIECEQRGMDTIICDMHNMPIPSGTYDAVLASHVLEHSVAPMFLLWEIWRVLKPGGLVFVNLPLPIDAEPRRDHPEIWDEATDTYRFVSDSLGRNLIPEATYYTYGFPPHLFVLTPYQWKWIFRQAGFRTLAACIETPSGDHWEIEDGLNRLGRQPHHCNQLFVLQREEPR